MITNKNIKIVALFIIVLLVGSFLFLRSQTEAVNENNIPQTEQEQISIVPVDTSLLIAAHSPTLGPKDAPVTIVEFLDPECEACSAMYPIVKKLMQEYDGKIQLVVRYMPFHGNSVFAANVLEAAHAQGKYWETLTAVFEDQSVWASHHDPKPELIYDIIKPLGLNLKKIKQSAESGQYNNLIEQDKADAEKLGVNRTPTFFVNGEQLYEMGYEPLKQLIQKKLN
jgi:protein-disulfide isomerase